MESQYYSFTSIKPSVYLLENSINANPCHENKDTGFSCVHSYLGILVPGGRHQQLCDRFLDWVWSRKQGVFPDHLKFMTLWLCSCKGGPTEWHCDHQTEGRERTDIITLPKESILTCWHKNVQCIGLIRSFENCKIKINMYPSLPLTYSGCCFYSGGWLVMGLQRSCYLYCSDKGRIYENISNS